MTLQQLGYFLALAELQSFTEAARRCRVAQPSLSQQIAKLEDELGAALFERTQRRVLLTDAGRVLFPRAQRIMQEVHDTEKIFARGISEEDGRVAVGAIPTMAPYVLPAAIAKFRKEFRGASVVITEDLTDSLVERLGRRELDVALMSTPPRSKLIEWEVVAREPFLVAVPAKSELAAKKRISPEALRHSKFIALSPMHCLGKQTEEFCQAARFGEAVVCESSQLSTVQLMVAKGVGVSLIPALCERVAPQPGVSYLQFAKGGGRQVVLAWPRGGARTRLASHFAGLLKEPYQEWSTPAA